MEKKFDKKKYDTDYKKEHYFRINVRINKKENEIIEHLMNVENRTSYIIELIRKDIKDANQ